MNQFEAPNCIEDYNNKYHINNFQQQESFF